MPMGPFQAQPKPEPKLCAYDDCEEAAVSAEDAAGNVFCGNHYWAMTAGVEEIRDGFARLLSNHARFSEEYPEEHGG